MEIIPSVIIICDIPELINDDFYAGKVRFGLKDPIFQPSLPLWHATELYNVLLDENFVNKPGLCLYTDGRPNHHCTYTYVQLSYICLFLALDLDYLIAIQTSPQHSWKNSSKHPVLGEDLHYKSSDELYGIQTTDNHRLSFKNAKTTKKDITTKVKHSMSFCPFAVHAKNIDKAMLQNFLDMIFYICDMAFHNTCDLAVTTPILLRQQNLRDNLEENLDEGDDCSEDESETLMMRMETEDKFPYCSSCNNNTTVLKNSNI
ncbi:hypothetical protein C1645_824344 [Glomus cerebriforme]|uniref:Uncharacterized protein n=1 Tax=Glomus cerebriforme TaxID=658196 RepID=A0A397SXM9_9GLOM|nr:hypothetical protein C1645_824344 [Glomus cerebriforme]